MNRVREYVRKPMLTISSVICAMIVTSAATIATDTVSMDKAWWDGLSSDGQLAAVQGFMNGYEGGYEDGYIHGTARASAISSPDNSSIISSTAFAVKSKATVHFGQTFGFYVSAIDRFYAEHPSLSEKQIGGFFGCFADDPIFSCDEAAKDLAN